MVASLADLLVQALGRRPDGHVSAAGEDAASGLELLDRAQIVAAALARHGVPPWEPVCVRIGNRPADLAALLGVWLAGAVAVPIHEAAAPAIAARIQAATRARFSVREGRVEVVSQERPPARPLLQGAALVIFTSGTTGLPKGAVIGHERLAGKIDVLGRLLRVRSDDVVLAPLQLTFIFGLWASILALGAGARLTLMPRFSSDLLAEELAKGTTVLACVPSMLRTLFASGRLTAPKLRMVMVGGEAFTKPLALALAEAWPRAGVYDLYGLTETGSCDFCLSPNAQPQGAGSLGSPTERVAFRLVGEDGAPAPPGSAGELQIRTPFGMLGYLDDAELTASSFSDGFFRTGDLARSRPDGRVELVGRIKEVISRGGNKVAPLEMDNLFGSHPDVAAALTVGVPDERLGESIHVMVVPKAGAHVDPIALRDWAAAQVERYKVPHTIHLCEALPVGQTGKADRRAALDEIRSRRPPGREGVRTER